MAEKTKGPSLSLVDNVVKLNAEVNSVTVRNALDKALEDALTDVIILGQDKDGVLKVRLSAMPKSTILWMIKQYEHHLITGE